jgi:uncharacterized phage protein (TIGR01671 family)
MNNRVIKFRVWNGMEMVYDVMIGKFGVFYVNPGSKGNGLDEKDSASITPFNTRYHNDTPVMQYTGHTDTYGVEIWEGDIVQFKSWRDALQRMEDNIMVVKYERGFFIPLLSFGDGPASRDFKVIGNVYQHPDLLKTTSAR